MSLEHFPRALCKSFAGARKLQVRGRMYQVNDAYKDIRWELNKMRSPIYKSRTHLPNHFGIAVMDGSPGDIPRVLGWRCIEIYSKPQAEVLTVYKHSIGLVQ